MKTSEILVKLDRVSVHVKPGRDREIKKGIVGDLLSFIMGTAPDGALWVTIHNHANVAAVALLKDIPLVILSSGKKPSPELEDHCRREDIALATAEDDSFDLCGKLFLMGIGTDKTA